MIDHCCANSGEVNTLLSLSLSLIFQLSFMFILCTLVKKQNQQIFSLVIFNLHKLDNNTLAVIEVHHPLYGLVLQRFILLQVV
jgi:hypothetical protein